MKTNLMLFIWFIKFGILTARDEYNVHDYIKERFCPQYIPEEEFDEKEQLLRDTPGPVGIKYAYYVGSKVGGISGAVMSIIALLLPVIIVTLVLFLAYDSLFNTGASVVTVNAVNGMHAATLGLIAAHLYKILYFNRTNAKSLLIIIPSALIFLFLPDTINMKSEVFAPFYMISIIVLGILFGFIHNGWAKYREKHPSKRFIDPHSKKAVKMRDKQLRAEEEALAKYMDDDSLKLRKQQLKEEAAEKERKRRGDE